MLEQIIGVGKPDALLPTVGGQTALNLAVELAEAGVLEQHGVEMIGASLRAIKVAEDRLWFKDACRKIGLDVPASALVNNLAGCAAACGAARLSVRHSALLSRSAARAAAIAYNREEFDDISIAAWTLSPVREVLIEESVIGLEGIRTRGDARLPRQLRHHLHHRKSRSDGRAYRRFDHRRACANADR